VQDILPLTISAYHKSTEQYDKENNKPEMLDRTQLSKVRKNIVPLSIRFSHCLDSFSFAIAKPLVRERIIYTNTEDFYFQEY